MILFFSQPILPQQYKSKVEELYYEYRETMLYIALSVVKDREHACDIVQQAFLRIIDHIEKIDVMDKKETKGYLSCVVRNLAIDHVRKAKRDATVSYEEIEYTVQDDGDSIEDIVMIGVDVKLVMEKMKSMDEKYSLPLMLMYTKELSIAEIAKLLGISPDAAKTRCHRGRKMLFELIRKEANREQQA